ncbi:hypothetical protein CTI12_AA174170 (chloroplast) [Artemisia annua]|uniref:Uncharacterized protein n=1 Tax=Artemisia annua TaxID=35608 RepID=A0A2U1PB57_ARTAN|nr:hypothetical protein CTI12_AA174170 [Artemisia annua]
MPQLHTSLHFHLTPIVMINGSSRRDLLLNSQKFCSSIPAGAENPSLSRLCYRRLWGSRNRRALILGLRKDRGSCEFFTIPNALLRPTHDWCIFF